jgi:hypothetical protein
MIVRNCNTTCSVVKCIYDYLQYDYNYSTYRRRALFFHAGAKITLEQRTVSFEKIDAVLRTPFASEVINGLTDGVLYPYAYD